MKVAINALSAKVGGGIIYLRNFPRALANLDPVNEYLIFISKSQESLIYNIPQNFQWRIVHFPSNPIIFRFLWEQLIFPILLKKEKVNLLYSTEFTSILAPCKVVLAVRNSNIYANLKTQLGLMNKIKRIIQRLSAAASMLKASRIIFVSEASRNHISRKMNIPLCKSVTIHHGLSSLFFQQPSNGTQEQEIVPTNLSYILAVSTIAKHKNYHNLLQSYALLRRIYSIEYDLVIAGKKVDADLYSQLEDFIKKEGISDFVHFLGEVEYTKLPGIYKNAHLFFFPSLLETFGHPLVEAMASGVPIAASNLPIISEICQDAAVYFYPYSVENMANAMYVVLSDETLQQKLRIQGLARAKDFSWEKAARETLAVFEEVYHA